MKTNTTINNQSLNKQRLNKKLKKDETWFVIRTTQSQLNEVLTDTHLQLELELAEIFWLDAQKVGHLIEWHKEEKVLTIASVMDDMERILALDHAKDKQYVYV